MSPKEMCIMNITNHNEVRNMSEKMTPKKAAKLRAKKGLEETNLQRMRVKKGLSQSELAERSGISLKTIQFRNFIWLMGNH